MQVVKYKYVIACYNNRSKVVDGEEKVTRYMINSTVRIEAVVTYIFIPS